MTVKFMLYLLTFPFVIWVVGSIRLEQIFKKNSFKQIVFFYVILSFSLTYLVVNFIYDLYLI
ncbi:MAG: DUF1146 family protein [Bacilli bacterium]|jgi:uncharacterized membrane protein YwzB